MAGRPQTRSGMTLEEFLRWPRIDRKPYLEYFDGRIEVKVSPQQKHSVIELRMAEALNRFAEPSRLGFAFPELRCTFAGRSMIPDVVYYRDANIRCDENGEFGGDCLLPPDIHVEVRSPDQTIKKTREKIEHSIAHGCPLGWSIDPNRRTIDVFRPGLPPERLGPDGQLDGAPVLPGFRVSVAEVWGWLQYRAREADGPGAEAR